MIIRQGPSLANKLAVAALNRKPHTAPLPMVLACTAPPVALRQHAGALGFRSNTMRPCPNRPQIVDIRESGRSYRFGPRGEMTQKHLVLQDGVGITRTMAMANVSSKPVGWG